MRGRGERAVASGGYRAGVTVGERSRRVGENDKVRCLSCGIFVM